MCFGDAVCKMANGDPGDGCAVHNSPDCHGDVTPCRIPDRCVAP
jgi:hypothetical protein